MYTTEELNLDNAAIDFAEAFAEWRGKPTAEQSTAGTGATRAALYAAARAFVNAEKTRRCPVCDDAACEVKSERCGK